MNTVKGLLDAKLNFKERYTYWIFSVALVYKAFGKWKIYVDYTDLNWVFLKDLYPLLNIDKLVESSISYKLLSCMDEYSDYNQIHMYDKQGQNKFYDRSSQLSIQWHAFWLEEYMRDIPEDNEQNIRWRNRGNGRSVHGWHDLQIQQRRVTRWTPNQHVLAGSTTQYKAQSLKIHLRSYSQKVLGLLYNREA